jgi:hypothetical protein
MSGACGIGGAVVSTPGVRLLGYGSVELIAALR